MGEKRKLNKKGWIRKRCFALIGLFSKQRTIHRRPPRSIITRAILIKTRAKGSQKEARSDEDEKGEVREEWRGSSWVFSWRQFTTYRESRGQRGFLLVNGSRLKWQKRVILLNIWLFLGGPGGKVGGRRLIVWKLTSSGWSVCVCVFLQAGSSLIMARRERQANWPSRERRLGSMPAGKWPTAISGPTHRCSIRRRDMSTD